MGGRTIVSDQERYLIAGKIVIDYAEARRNLAALHAKAARVADGLRAVADALHKPKEHWSHHSIPPGGSEWSALLAKLPTREEIEQLGQELHHEEERRRRLSHMMAELGCRPMEN